MRARAARLAPRPRGARGASARASPTSITCFDHGRRHWVPMRNVRAPARDGPPHWPHQAAVRRLPGRLAHGESHGYAGQAATAGASAVLCARRRRAADAAARDSTWHGTADDVRCLRLHAAALRSLEHRESAVGVSSGWHSRRRVPPAASKVRRLCCPADANRTAAAFAGRGFCAVLSAEFRCAGEASRQRRLCFSGGSLRRRQGLLTLDVKACCLQLQRWTA